MNDEFKDLNYRILNTRSVLGSPDEPLYNQVYDFWKNTWKTIFEKVGSPEAWLADDFYRQDYIPVLTYRDEIVAAHYYTVFDTRDPSLKDLRYFSIFPQSSIDWLDSNQFSKIMSMEFLTVAKNWRKGSGNISFAEVLIALGFNLMIEQNFDASVGVAVKGTGVDLMAQRLNCDLLTEDIKRGNLQCCLVAQTADNVIKHPDFVSAALIKHLWENRQVTPTQDETFTKIAA